MNSKLFLFVIPATRGAGMDARALRSEESGNPESLRTMKSKALDPGLRRDDGIGVKTSMWPKPRLFQPATRRAKQ
jgi:hypothetical protein